MTEEQPPSGYWKKESFAVTPEDIHSRHESNRLSWNEGASHGYTPRIENTIDFIRSGQSSLHKIEKEYLAGILSGCDLAVHLQCASGKDTLSLLNEGVKRVIGVDISDVQIDNARRASAALNAPAEWIRCDILDIPETLNESADLIYTGRGAINWIQDINAWAVVVGRLLKPGGWFSIFDGHPITWLFDQEAESYQFNGTDYFATCESGMGWPNAYIGDIGIPLEKQSRKYECLWPVSTVFQVLTRVGLSVVHFGEYPEPYWKEFPNLKPELAGKIPNTFSILARKP